MARVAIATVTTAGGGVLLSNIDSLVRLQFRVPGVVGTRVAGHGIGPHSGAAQPVVVAGSATVFCGGLPLAREGDQVSCGDVLVGGSGTVDCG